MNPSAPYSLEAYFADVGPLRALFGQWLSAPALNRRLLILYGMGGMVKSSRLRMFRLQAWSA